MSHAFPAYGKVLEPCGGSGNLIRGVKPFYPHVKWYAVEKREECKQALELEHAHTTIIDFLDPAYSPLEKMDTIITNPPYSHAEEFIRKSIRIANNTFVLLRLNFLSSAKRIDLFQRFMPDVYVLPNRPSFTGEGTDSTDYGWFHWKKGQTKREGQILVLDGTPIEQRKAG